MRPVPPVLLALLLCACTLTDPPPEAAAAGQPEPELLAVYYPTPEWVAERMLEAAELKPREVHFDLGSGDGRFVLAAAGRFDADSTGFEIDNELVSVSRGRIRRAGLQDHARILDQDLLTADFAAADVITAFLAPESYEKLEPILREKLRPDARLVAYKFPLPGWTPEQVITLEDEDPEIPTHKIYVYRGPPAG